MEIKLRDYQLAAHEATFQYFFNGGNGNPLIVAPTGSGKSVIIAYFIREALRRWSTTRILMLAHRKELIQQNFTKLIQLWPEAPVGVYSAGLKARQLGRAITMAGVQSVHKKAMQLGWIDLMLVDEAHLIPSGEAGDGMYRGLIKALKEQNPKMKIIGYTATPYRLKTGLLTDLGGVFTDIAYNIEVSFLVKRGYLAPLVSKNSSVQADLSKVRVQAGEYVAGDVERVMDDEALTQAAIDEMEIYLKDRKSWIVFASGVEHAQHVAAALNARGHEAEVVVGDTDDMFRARTIERFRQQKFKVLVNCDVLTTGFDAPGIDAIVLLRPTKSTGLYVQMLGRGMRTAPGKVDCIVLDFGGNIVRHGPIDQIEIKRKNNGSGSEVGTAPVKTCPECRTAISIAVMECPTCGYVFPANPTHDVVATEAPVMTTIQPPERLQVVDVQYKRNVKDKVSLRVIYNCQPEKGNMLRSISEWVCLEHRGFPRDKAVSWWKEHHVKHETPEEIVIPILVDEAMEQLGDLRKPTHIYVQKDEKFDRIVSRRFESKPVIKAEQLPLPKPAEKVEDKPDDEDLFSITGFNI